jgi:hypothetical protein
MSAKPIVLDPDIQRLQNEGYEVEIRNGHLLVHAVPYVNAQCKVLRGVLVTELNGNLGQLGAPANHQVWVVGDYPCRHTGIPIESIRHSSGPMPLWSGFEAQHRFSNKPEKPFPDYYSKMVSYVTIISNQARAIDPGATAQTFQVIESVEDDSVFRYWDSASSRSNTLAVSAKLAMNKVAIVGLGGTGSYVLDLVAKTPVKEIHLFDGDTFRQYNAFRAPGAATAEVLDEQLTKVEYFARQYDPMRRGIFPHFGYVTEENIQDLAGFDFVFLCVDRGPVRRVISDFLRGQRIPFVDVGMEIELLPELGTLIGTCRATMCTSEKSDHFERHVPMKMDEPDDLYRSNIQVADMNALNAILAVLQWKQYCGFYQDIVRSHHLTYSVNVHSLTRDEMTGVPALVEGSA